jgi:hypothetical protein
VSGACAFLFSLACEHFGWLVGWICMVSGGEKKSIW